MIIDVHGHVSAPTELWAYKANLDRPLVHRGMQQYHSPSDETFSRQVDRRLRFAANGGRSDSERDPRARALRQATGVCRLSFESGPVRKQRHGSAAARRPLLVSAL